MTTFGTSASYIAACMKAGHRAPRRRPPPEEPNWLGSTGLAVSPRGIPVGLRPCRPDTWLFSMSGGTDVCTAFVGGVPTLPVYLGELQARALGANVQAWTPDGRSLMGKVGELVIIEPMPSMPVCILGR